ncbi:MAG: TonB-dependent receptor plug domain-containing protein [Bacteroidota bacterium]
MRQYTGTGLSWFVVLFLITFNVLAQESDVKKLKSLSIEELMNIEVTSVSKVPQKLSEVASAVQVITNEDIRRSGATNIPEALRLSPNLQVSQLNSSAWIISARGFNTVFANKLLVLIDGRTVYTPLFGGVIWDIQSVLLEDVDRIEVISGPGGSLWGANAVNGVINIITKKARDTHGLFLTGAGGDFMKTQVAARYADSIGSNFFYRVYGQHSERNSTYHPDGTRNADSWKNTQMGFNLGFYPTSSDEVTVQGDVNLGNRESTLPGSVFDTQNILARWNHTANERSNFSLQAYYDRYWTNDPLSFGDELRTVDLDFQYKVTLAKKHKLLWGLGYRNVHDHVLNRGVAGLVPEKRVLPIYSGFIQDEISLTDHLKLTIGSKFLHNVYTGFEFQPSARLAFSPSEKNTLWTAVSHAIRAPSRLDVDYFLPIEPQPPSVPSVAGGPNFQSERLNAFEAGYRTQPSSKISMSFATFYNIYNDIYSVETLPGTQTYQIQNGSAATSWGGEFSGTYQVTNSWRLRGGFTYFGKDLHAKAGHVHDPSYLANDAKHHLMLQSMLNLPFNFNLDIVARYMDYIPASFATVRIPEYATADVRLAFTYKAMEIAVTGQNLARSKHSEYDALKIPRSYFGRLTFRF